MNRKIPRRVTLVALAQCRQSEARQEGVPDSSPRRLITPSATGSSMRLTLRVIHKYVSLAVAALWLMQAATGLLLVFHWELDDLSVRGAARALDVERFGAFLERLQAASPDRTVSSVFASGGVHGRFDVLIANSSASEGIRSCGWVRTNWPVSRSRVKASTPSPVVRTNSVDGPYNANPAATCAVPG